MLGIAATTVSFVVEQIFVYMFWGLAAPGPQQLDTLRNSADVWLLFSAAQPWNGRTGAKVNAVFDLMLYSMLYLISFH